MHQHYVSVHPDPSDNTGRSLFIRLPFYHGLKEQPSINDVYANICPFGVVANIEQVDGQGGYYVTLGDNTERAWAAAMGIMQCLHGRANLQGEVYYQDCIPIREEACGSLFGHRGDNLRAMKASAGADIEVTPWSGESATRSVIFHGTYDQVENAKALVLGAIRESAALSAEPVANFTPPPPRDIIGNSINAESLVEFPALDSRNKSGSSTSASIEPTVAIPVPLPAAVIVPNTAEVTTIEPPTSNTEATTHSKVALRRVTSSLIRKANWCLLKDRLSVMNDLRNAVTHFWETKAQMERAQSRGIKFGVRSKSWLELRSRDPKPTGFTLSRTTSEQMVVGAC